MADENAAVDAGASDGATKTAAETTTGADKTAAAGAGKDKADTGTIDTTGKAVEAAKDDDNAKAANPDHGELQVLRETLAGGDEGILKALERYKSKEAIGKAFREARTTAKNAGKPVRLADKATEDDVKAFREAMGIPDEAKDYPVNFREDFKASDADKEILGSFKEYMHGKSADPKAAEAALEWYQDFAQEQQQALDGNLAKVAKQTQAELRTEWGGEYDGNIGAIHEFMTAQLGQEGFGRMMGLRLMDGSRLQDDPAFVKMMAQVSTDYYGSNAIYNGDIETTSKTVQERIDALLELRGGDAKAQEKYFSDATQAELTKLYAQKQKIEARR